MKRTCFVIALLFFAVPVHAQQQPTASDRIAMQIGQLVITIEKQKDTIAALEQQLTKLQAENKRLTENKEPQK